MTDRTIFLFPDTNVFVQCKALSTLDWSWLGEADEIVLIVTRPIQDQIDDHKQRRKGRVSDRARVAYAELRKLIIEKSEKVVRATTPRVILRMGLTLKPTRDLELIDYDDADDLLVAITHAFTVANPGADARVLSHDGGPLGTAGAFDVPIAPIPDAWLLDPEPSEADRKLAVAGAAIARLRKTEPEFAIKCFDDAGGEINKLEIVNERYPPLSDDEIAGSIKQVAIIHPIATDFGPTEQPHRPAVPGMSAMRHVQQVCEPADPEDIESFRNERYPDWLRTYEYKLRHLHYALDVARHPPRILFEAVNTGTRPALSVKVEITARGAFEVRPPQRDEPGDADDAGNESSITLPSPPRAPCGRWRVTSGPALDSVMDQMRRQLDPFGVQGLNPNSLFAHSPVLAHDLISPFVRRAPEHDPDGFYYKGRRPSEPVAAFALTCDQWRHSIDVEPFETDLFVTAEQLGDHNGLLSMHVHAENLREPARNDIPVRITVRGGTTLATAERLVEALKPKFAFKGLGTLSALPHSSELFGCGICSDCDEAPTRVAQDLGAVALASK